ncbi:UDP-Glc:alpha-D-GlcNAc-diphosphoundecaprenol beta-1,3-glucosyltransferase WfgD [mine drainage metagenome]|uniref:UDP-Glc:alpha-D-GlcNAc-diphosphoundecaprenol beta-1,3-glucosyltransferase WfgD n=1 Tax=mine drainage metagenome TaxID=410659 RepID=A0A1J5SFM2_9ZZZZ
MEPPLVSIVMPVFNTGGYLREAIDSVLQQQALDNCALPAYELILVDDRSSDPETLAILESAPRLDARIRVLKNERAKGAAGGRNTGILNARGAWVGFLDSDDLWLPKALAVRWRFILDHPEAKWIAAQYFLLKPEIGLVDKPLSVRSPNLYAAIKDDYEAGRTSLMARPVEMLAKNCLVSIGTVLIDRELLLAKEMFNEGLRRAEDYHLWFKCARDHDLWMLPFDVAVYRIRPGSLTHGDDPKYLFEDRMIALLLQDRSFEKYENLLRERLDLVLRDHCDHYRIQKMYGAAFHWASKWVTKRPLAKGAWKQLLASVLRF